MTTDERILVLMPTAKDGERMGRILADGELGCAVCKDLAQLCREISLGAGAAMLTEETVVGDRDGCLLDVLRDQPPWSDFPLVVLAREGTGERGHLIREAMNATLVERPVKVRSLLSVVRAALRSRRRQYEVRDHMEERLRAADTLRRSEERYRALVEATSQVVWSWPPDGANGDLERTHLWWKEVTGQTPEQQRGSHTIWLEVVHPEDREEAGAAWGKALTTGMPYDVEYRVQARDGGWRYIQARGIPIAGPNGSPREWVGTLSDVTDRKRAEADNQRLLLEVEAERRRLADVFQHAPSFMCVLRGPEHVFERANDRYQELVGRRDVLGRPVREAVPEAEGQGFFEILDRVYQTGESFAGTNARIMLLRGGVMEERFLDFVYQPLRDAGGTVSGIIVQGIDITERKRAEADVVRVTAESERRKRLFETALSNTPDLIFVFGLDHRFAYANEALLTIWGRTWDEAIGKNCLELGYEPWQAAQHDSEVDQVIATRRPIHGEVQFTGTQGRRVYDYIFAPVFGAGGEVEAVAGTARDTTDRKAMEEELRDAGRKKDDFIALLAHELRNPLAPIRNGLQILRLAGGDVDAVGKARAMMDRQLTHMVRLIDDLLDVSRISRNKMELRRARVLLGDVVGSAVETARPLIDAAGHDLSLSMPPGPVFLDADLTRLAQVFSNLLANSAKYTEQGGKIRLAAERCDGDVVVTVRDNGIGIPAASMDNIFDMFSQVDRSVERSTGGLGIGLALVKGLVEMHGGTVTAASEGEGKGSAFMVRLPAMEGRAIPQPGVADNGQHGPCRRVLVVDDNHDGAASMAMMLHLMGDEVRTAHDGVEAVEIAEQFHPEVILMDVGMPRLNGLDATRYIRKHPWGRDMTIIALTGWGQNGDKERSREAGCNGHLVKPVNLQDLEKLLGEMPER